MGDYTVRVDETTIIVTTITSLKNSWTNLTTLKTEHWIALMTVMIGSLGVIESTGNRYTTSR